MEGGGETRPLSDHASRPTPFSLSPAFGPAALARLGLGTALFCQCWLRMRPLPLPSRLLPPFLQAPPHPRTLGTRPHHSVGKLPGGGDGSDTRHSTGLGAHTLCSLTVRPPMSSCSHSLGTLGAHPSCRCPCPSPVPGFSRKQHLGLRGVQGSGPLAGGQRRGARSL